MYPETLNGGTGSHLDFPGQKLRQNGIAVNNI
jgi:hypothetical protein